MNFTDKHIYELLPSYCRIKDAELSYTNDKGEPTGPLLDLIQIIAGQAGIAEKNIGDLYNNWFIETCEKWVVPYIGDLLGVRSLNAVSNSSSIVSQRAYVANTIAYRRRKGIAPVLEQLALDVAGWRAHVVEFFEYLCTTQYMKHIRLHRPASADLRKMDQLDRLNGPFDTIAHTGDVRHILNGRGKYNIPNIGLFVWRLQSYPVTFSEPLKLPCTGMPGEFFFTFDPVGYNINLFNKPQTETSITHISTEINVPGLLRRRVLFDELEARRQAMSDNVTPKYNFFDERNEYSIDLKTMEDTDNLSRQFSVFEIFKEHADHTCDLIPPEEILICNMEKCCTPPTELSYMHLNDDGTYTEKKQKIQVAVDPVWGKFKFSKPGDITNVRVSYSYGFSGDVGAGTYDRQDSIPDIFQQEIIEEGDPPKKLWQVGVSRTIVSTDPNIKICETIKEAITIWNGKDPGDVGLIVIMDNCSYADDIDITIHENSQLLLIAADWPLRNINGIEKRTVGDITAAGLRPHINGKISVTGKKKAGLEAYNEKTGGALTINGLLVQGKLSVKKGNLGALNIISSTIIPGNGGLEVGTGIGINNPEKKLSNQWLKINLQKTICGSVLLNMTPIVSLETADCIIDNTGGWAVKAEEAPVRLGKTTFFGNVIAKTIEAENCIFSNNVKAIRRQSGCIRFSFVAIKNIETPRRYRCQPDLEIATQIEEVEKTTLLTEAQKNIIRQDIAAWLVPVFTSTHYGHHAYAQLAVTCPEQVSSGSDDGSEMGAFSFLMQPQRSANLRIALDEYLRLGLEAGIFFAT